MSNARKIVIMADAAISDSPIDSQTLGPVRFRRGDDLLVEATFLQNEIVADMSAAQSAVLEILDVGSMNAPDPRTVALLMRKEVVEFSNPICDSSGKLDLEADGQVPHAVFKFSNIETQIASGERWLCLRVEFSDGSKLSFASGWIFVEENFLSDPELLPIENPQYIKRDEAGLLFLNKSANLSDLESKDLARSNLDIYSKLETKSLISESLEFLPAYKEELESIKGDVESAKNIAISTVDEAEQAVSEITLLASDLEKLKEDVQIAKQAAEAAAQEAQAISDPDGLLQKHDSEISALQASKANVGEHFLNKGRLVFSDLANKLTFPFTVMLTYEVAEWPSGVRVVFGAQNVTGFSVSKGSNGGMYISLQLRSGATYAFYVDSQMPTGKHTLCVNFYIDENDAKARCDVYIDGILQVKRGTNDSATAPFEFSQALPNFVINSDSSTFNQTSNSNGYSIEMSVSRVYIFNFDAAAEDAPYTVSDYAEGKLPSLLLRQGILSTPDPTMGASTGSGWNITSTPSATGSTTNGLWRVGNANLNYCANTPSEELPEGISYGVDLSTKNMSNMETGLRLVDDASYSMVKYAGKSVWVRCSFMYRKTPANVYGNTNLRVGFYTNWLVDVPSSDVTDNNWHTYDEIFKVSVGSTLKYTSQGMVGLCNAGNPTVTDQPMWSIADFNWEVLGEALELADSRSAYQIKDLSGNGNHATIFGDVISRKNEDPTIMQVEYTWGAGVSTGAYIMGDTVTLPANSEIEILAKSSASATLSLGTSSSATTTFANAASVGTTAKSIAKFYTADAAQKLFATPSVAGLTINLTLKITSLK